MKYFIIYTLKNPETYTYIVQHMYVQELSFKVVK